MAKVQFADPHLYAAQMSNLLGAIEKIGETSQPYYDQLKNAIENNTLIEMPKSEFDEIKREFTRAVASHKEVLDVMKRMDVPVRFTGMHEVMVKYYQDYVESTEKMADSVNEGQTVNFKNFNEADKEQDEYIEKFSLQLKKIMKAQV